MAKNNQAKNDDNNDSKKPTTKEGVNQKAGLDQLDEKASLAQEGPGGNPNKAGILPGQQINEETTSPLADSIEAEKLAQYKKSEEENQE